MNYMRLVTLSALASFCLLSTSGAAKDDLNPFLATEISTFNSSNFARFNLQQEHKENETTVTQLDLQFRTSYANGAHLFSIENGDNETLIVEFDTTDRIKLRLRWLLDPEDSGLVDEESTLQAPGVGSGQWQRLTVNTGSNRSLVLNGNRILGQLPESFIAQFAWNNLTAIVVAGSGFQGCLANFSLDEVVPVPLHSQSELINSTDHLILLESVSNLPENSGCRQASCQCEPNGVCIYRQWDVLDRCNCTRGYEPDSFCRNEWDTCKNLESQYLCLNKGNCSNKPGIDTFSCSCTSEYLGSRCQSFDYCRSPITCQNGAQCKLTGNVEQPNTTDYNCTCARGFTGRNCTVADGPSVGPDTGLIVGITVSVIAILLLAIVAFVVAKVVRDRRRDSGAYRPSHREASRGANSNGAGGIAMGSAMRPPLDERLI